MRKQNLLPKFLKIAIISGLVGWYVYIGQGHIAYSMDSLTYRDVASNILKGNGLVTTNTFNVTPQFVPLLQWPPAYPAVWAAMVVAGVDIDHAPRMLSLLLFIITLTLVYVIGTKLAKNNLAGAIAAFLYTALPTGLAIFNFAWSETLFIPSILLAFFALLQYSDARGNPRIGWLAVAVVCIALANWTRYTGAIFLPLLGISVLVLSEGRLAKRLKESALTLAASMLLVGPLWVRNHIMTGTISGSNRGGHTRIAVARHLAGDLETLWNLMAYPLFNFDTVLYAFLGWPLVALVTYVAWKNRKRLLKPSKSVLLAFVWAATNLAFLLYARIVQQGIDFDYRMLAIPAPFFIVGAVALLVERLKTAQSLLLATLVMLMSITFFAEGQRVHEQIAGRLFPDWRALSFGIIYTDLTKDFGYSKNIQLPTMADNATILTDYRGIYMRYLTNHPAYQVVSAENCASLKQKVQSPLAFVVIQPTKYMYFDNSKTPTAKCAVGSL